MTKPLGRFGPARIVNSESPSDARNQKSQSLNSKGQLPREVRLIADRTSNS